MLGLSARELQFAQLVALGVAPAVAAGRVGLSPGRVADVLGLPAVRAIVRHAGRSQIVGSLLPVSITSLRDILVDPAAPAAARVQAARLVWQAAGMLDAAPVASSSPPHAVGHAPPPAGADGELAALRDRLEALRLTLATAQPIDVSPDPLS